jgi:hypothetical protein
MEMQQIMKMLAKLDANTKPDREEIKQEIRADQKHMQEMKRTG